MGFSSASDAEMAWIDLDITRFREYLAGLRCGPRQASALEQGSGTLPD